MFQPGQRVICVNDEPTDYRPILVTKGHTYTIKEYWEGARGPGVTLMEVEPKLGPGWHTWRFRPIVEQKTDIIIFTKMLNIIKQKEPA